MTIEELIEEAHTNAIAHGWWDEEREAGTTLMLVVSELAEALEELRNGKAMPAIRFGPDGKPEGFTVELADAVIRLADLCGRYQLPLLSALRVKLAYNRTRPYKHGKAL